MRAARSLGALAVLGALLVVEIVGYALADKISSGNDASVVKTILLAAGSLTIIASLIVWGTRQ